MKKTMSMVIVSCIFLMLFFVSPIAEAQADEMTELDISQGSIVFHATGAAGGGLSQAETELNPAGYIVIQSGAGATANTITINSGVSVTITLSGVNINSSSAALKIADNSSGNVTLIIADGTENFLQSGNGHAGIEKNGNISSGSLVISGDTLGTGILNSHGALGSIGSLIYGGAGIGGSVYSGTANITIRNAKVTAIGGHWAAGIGGGLNGSGSNITIMDSTVRATTGTEGAGIGGGSNGTGSNIIIAGSSVYAAAGWAGNNIGGGRYRSALTPTSDGMTPVYRTDITLSDVISPITEVKAVNNISVEGLSGYYTDHTLYTTDTGVLYLWLPAETTVKSLNADTKKYVGSVVSAGSGVLTIETIRLNLGDGVIRIYPDRFIQGATTYQFSGKYEITGYLSADTPLQILNDTDTPVEYDITLDNASIYGATWCTAVRVDNNAPTQSGNPENLVVNLHIEGTVIIFGSNHPGLQSDSKSIVNLSGNNESRLTCTQWYSNNAVSANITLNMTGTCALVLVNDQPADITAAYTQKPLVITFFDEHTPGDWIIELEADCVSDGLRKQYCEVCGEIAACEVIPALGHTPGDWIIELEADCVSDGLRKQYCEVCGEIVASEVIPALGHTPGDWIIELEADCVSDGLRKQYCEVCGEILASEAIPALGHTPGEEASCEQAQICVICGDVLVPAAGHEFIDGVCVVCGESDPDYTEIPKTGENSSLYLAVFCFITAISLVALRRRLAHHRRDDQDVGI